MIYTVTLNPAVDYHLKVDTFILGATNRSMVEEMRFGGKGINVSYVLRELGFESVALGFVGGFVGAELENMLVNVGLKTDFVHLSEGNTRVNVKIKSQNETEINANGPSVSSNELKEFFEKIEGVFEGDTLVLAGSVPSTLPQDIYAVIAERLKGKNVRLVVDATDNLLKSVLKYKPFLIKPNKAELEEMAGRKLFKTEDIIDEARRLQEKGAQNVLVSLGGEGALLLDSDNNIHHHKSLCRKTIDTVGAGDSTVAGFLAGVDRGYPFAFSLALAAGGATAGSYSLAKRDEIYTLLKEY